MRKGTLFVVSAPSATGKGTILARVLAKDDRLQYSLSATTRPARKGEINGKDYIFLDVEEFQRWITEGRFVEWAQVHGNFYGTVRQKLNELLANGLDIILELDVQGMLHLKEHRDDVLAIFIMPPSMEELERRLRSRGGHTEPEIQTRLKNAEDEVTQAGHYDHTIVNGDLDKAVAEFERVVRKNRKM